MVGSSIDVWENLYRETVLVRVQVLISANIDKVLARLQADIKGNNEHYNSIVCTNLKSSLSYFCLSLKCAEISFTDLDSNVI